MTAPLLSEPFLWGRQKGVNPISPNFPVFFRFVLLVFGICALIVPRMQLFRFILRTIVGICSHLSQEQIRTILVNFSQSKSIFPSFFGSFSQISPDFSQFRSVLVNLSQF